MSAVSSGFPSLRCTRKFRPVSGKCGGIITALTLGTKNALVFDSMKKLSIFSLRKNIKLYHWCGL